MISAGELVDVPFGNATFAQGDAILPEGESSMNSDSAPPTRDESSRRSSRRRSSTSSSSRRQGGRRRSSASSTEEDDAESLLLAKRTDQLIADFQKYICDIENGTINNNESQPTRRTSADEVTLSTTSSSSERRLTPQDPPEGQVPSSSSSLLSQRRKYSPNKNTMNLHRLKLKTSRVHDEENGASCNCSTILLCCSKDQRSIAWYSNKLSPWKALMLVCSVIGSLIAIATLATHQKRASINHTAHLIKTPEASLTTAAEALDIDKLNWFHRPQYTGQTYASSLSFCESHHQVLCSYSTICPSGPGSKPINGGFSNDPTNKSGLAWVATSDAINSWAQVGSKDYCLKYEFMHGGVGPSWGVSGEDNEEITQHVACCPPSDDYDDGTDAKEDNSSNSEEDLNASDHSAIISSVAKKPKPEPLSISLHQDFDPVWYTHSDGWHGSTYNEALTFCLTKEERSPCPYEAYCPEGPHHPPRPILPSNGTGNGSEEESSERRHWQSWSPIINEIGHGIVQVGGGTSYEEDTTLCKIQYLHDDENDDKTVNKGMESLMTHVMCCHLVDRESFGILE